MSPFLLLSGSHPYFQITGQDQTNAKSKWRRERDMLTFSPSAPHFVRRSAYEVALRNSRRKLLLCSGEPTRLRRLSGSHPYFQITGQNQANVKSKWRRERDSNPRGPFEPTRLPSERTRPTMRSLRVFYYLR